jgi:hypothetical protein
MTALSLQQLHALVPKACAWAEDQERLILTNGVALSSLQLADARAVGVKSPERIRLLRVDTMPLPSDPILHQAAQLTGLLTPNTIGLTLRYGIFIRDDSWDDRPLLTHEFAHTAQYERLGGFFPFLWQYLTECVVGRYPNTPMEHEAVAAAKRVCGGS